jgi:hypothetical protein
MRRDACPPGLDARDECCFDACRWHCLVGRNFGCFVTHEASRFVYFYIGQVRLFVSSS